MDVYRRVDFLRSYLSLGCLASSLTSRLFLSQFALGKKLSLDKDFSGFDISVVQLSLRGRASITGYIEDFFNRSGIDPLMVCTTATSAQLKEAGEIAYAVKRITPGSLRVIGGPHVSILPEKTLQGSEFQIACTGEGVETITELALNMGLYNGKHGQGGISGIVYKEGNSIRRNKDREDLFSLDDYPYPSNSLPAFVNDLDDRTKNARDIVYILGGFGCPFNCTFCAQKAIHKGKIRERSAENIIGEIKTLSEKGFKRFAIVQETFTSNKERIRKFCSLLEKHSLDIEWTAESRVDQISLGQLKEMKRSGLKLIQLGLETGDQELLKSISKKSKLKDAAILIDWLKRLKINTSIYLLTGLPRQGWQSILRTVLFFINNIPYNTATIHASTSITIPYPGTEIFENKKIKILKDKGLGKGVASNWQSRNPKIHVNNNGEFIGNSFTETEVMTSREILESYIYIDDICYSILHSKYDNSLSLKKRLRFLDYANKLIYMIERRTIRDIIVFAQENVTIEKKKESISELDRIDEGEEKHFKDVIGNYEENQQNFRDFLSQITFLNGYDILKGLSIANRIKWIKFCCILWGYTKKSFNKILFSDEEQFLKTPLNDSLSKKESRWFGKMIKDDTSFSDAQQKTETDKYFSEIGVTFKVENDICRFRVRSLE